MKYDKVFFNIIIGIGFIINGIRHYVYANTDETYEGKYSFEDIRKLKKVLKIFNVALEE